MRKFLLVLCLWAVIVPHFVLAQLSVSMPTSRIVFQRDANNRSLIPVTGVCPTGTTRIEARLITRASGQGTSTDWTSINATIAENRFRGSITGQAGWYNLEVRAIQGTTATASLTVERIGVGEVFLVAGQSNASGGHQATPGSVDDRVSCVNYSDGILTESNFPYTFSHVDAGTRIGPYDPLYIWGMLGDSLTKRLNVPILFYGAAQGGTSSETWKLSAELNMSTPLQWDGKSDLRPYRLIGATIVHYISRTGLRAILWHQGESDIGVNPQTYFDNISFVINKTRQQSSHSPLAWLVSRATYMAGSSDPNIINAQNRLIAEVPNVFAGPYTDSLVGPQYRFDDIHFGGEGLTKLTQLWNQSISSAFFSKSTPLSLPSLPPAITTGYVWPFSYQAGETIKVPYLKTGDFFPDNLFKVQLLTESGSLVSELSGAQGDPLLVTLPQNTAPNTYKVRVVSTHPAIQGTISEKFQVISAPAVNLPPVLQNPIPMLTVPPSQFFSYTIPANTFYDPEGKPLTYQITGLIAGIGANSTGFAGIGFTIGQYPITITAIDAANQSTSTTMILNISNSAPANQAPIPVAMPAQTAQVGQAFSYTIPSFTDPEGKLLTYSASGVPAGLIFNTATCVLSGTPTGSGNFQVTITATDPGGLSASSQLALSISSGGTPPPAGNQPPVLQNPIPMLTVPPFQFFSYTIPANTFSDPEGKALTYQITGLIAGVGANSTGFAGIGFTIGQYPITITATDPDGLSVSTTMILNISNSAPANQAPKPVAMAAQTAQVGQAFSYTIPAFSDPEGQALSYSASGVPAGLSFNPGTRVLSGTPTGSGNFQVTITATDPGGLSASAQLALSISSGGTPPPTGNQPPVLQNPIPMFTVVAGQPFSYSIPANTFRDPEGGSLTYQISGLVMGIGPSSTGFAGIGFTPGDFTITVTAVDAGGLSTTTTMILRIVSSSNVPTSEPPIETQGAFSGATVRSAAKLPDWHYWPNAVSDELKVALPVTPAHTAWQATVITESSRYYSLPAESLQQDGEQLKLDLSNLKLPAGVLFIRLNASSGLTKTLRIYKQ